MHWTGYALERRVKRNHKRGSSVSIKLVVLYPSPREEQVFERAYHEQHIPLMRGLIAPATRLRTYRVRLPDGAPFYRLAEIDFVDLAEATAFGQSEGANNARRSARDVSTGGKPWTLICERDPA
jgi:uncharacterized protein (TIGR02118 family)